MKKLFNLLILAFSFLCVYGEDYEYGLPAEIQDGNILHCFDWPIKEVKAELPAIAEAGFGAIQLSPLQRPDVKVNYDWHALYRPYDLSFKSSSFCTEQDLKDLCAEASKYGIKIIVDIVANHVDKTASYHDTWWDSNNRIRFEGGIDYNNRYSITHGQLGDYGDIVSENPEVIAKAKAYVEKLQSLGVKGIRWDAAKHIGLPSEGCNFWESVTSVPGMYHYGEILDNPGPNPSIIKEYAGYMSVTDNQYSNNAARYNGGIPTGNSGKWVTNYNLPQTKMVYWGESHDTYSNDEWSQNVDQSIIDRAYAANACRNGATALYLSRPFTKGFDNIKVEKGSTAFKNSSIAEINKFKNAMIGKPDYFYYNGNNACSITRKDGGAVIVMKGSGNISISNGGGYCPVGTYKDKISGNTFNVTDKIISGIVGATGIAVLYSDQSSPEPTPEPVPAPDEFIIYYDNSSTNWENVYIHYWSNPTTTWPGDLMIKLDNNIWKYKFPSNPSEITGLLFDAGIGKDQTADYLQSPINNHLYKGYPNKGQVTDCGIYEGNIPTPDPTPGPNSEIYIYFDNSNSHWNIPYIHYWGGEKESVFPGIAMTRVVTRNNDEMELWTQKVPTNTSGILFNAGDGDNSKTGDFVALPNAIYNRYGHTGQFYDNLTGIEALYNDDVESPIYYDLFGNRIEAPSNGIYIKIQGNKASKIYMDSH